MSATPGILVNGELYKGVYIWHDNSPPVVDMIVKANDGLLHVYNIWDSHRGYGHESQSYTSGMLIEDAGPVRTYSCNDIGTTPDFSKLVFSLEFLPLNSNI
jgi:hypothetical protein